MIDIVDNIFTKRAMLSKSPNSKFDTTTVRYMFVVYGKHKNNKELRQRHKLSYFRNELKR